MLQKGLWNENCTQVGSILWLCNRVLRAQEIRSDYWTDDALALLWCCCCVLFAQIEQKEKWSEIVEQNWQVQEHNFLLYRLLCIILFFYISEILFRILSFLPPPSHHLLVIVEIPDYDDFDLRYAVWRGLQHLINNWKSLPTGIYHKVTLLCFFLRNIVCDYFFSLVSKRLRTDGN